MAATGHSNECIVSQKNEIVHAPYQQIPRVPFYFLRHGTTDWNKEMLVDGPQDLYLNDKGTLQVQQTIPILCSHPISCIFTSPLKRCIETAEMISQALEDIPIFVITNLEERRFGDWSKCKDKARELVKNAPDGPGFFQYIKDKIEKILPDDAEKKEEFEERIHLGIIEALDKSKLYPDYPLILGHGCVKIAIKKAMRNIQGEDQSKLFTQPIFFSPRENEENSWYLLNLD